MDKKLDGIEQQRVFRSTKLHPTIIRNDQRIFQGNDIVDTIVQVDTIGRQIVLHKQKHKIYIPLAWSLGVLTQDGLSSPKSGSLWLYQEDKTTDVTHFSINNFFPFIIILIQTLSSSLS